MGKVSLQDIADTLEISKVTVSNALSGKKGVSDTLRKRILEKASELGYTPTHVKDGIPNIALVVPKRNIFYGDFAFYTTFIINFLQSMQGNYNTYTYQISDEDEANLVVPDFPETDIVVCIATFSNAYKNKLRETGKLMVSVDSYKAPFLEDAVFFNNYIHGYQIADYLISLGHRSIGFIGDIMTSSSRMDRYLGIQKALIEKGIGLDTFQLYPYNLHEYPYSDTTTLFEKLPSAVICHSDKCAHNLIMLCHSRGIRIPEDVSIVGFDNIALSKEGNFLTTIDIDTEKLAKETLRIIEWRLDNPTAPPKITSLNGELIIRKSAARIEGGIE